MIKIPRFYKKKVPDIDEHVICIVKEIDENCIYFHISEYNQDVLVPFKELNECRGKKAKYKIAKKYKVNSNHIFYVTKADNEIEISNRGIDEETIKEFTSHYNNKKFVINIFKDFLNNLNIKDEDGYIEYANKTIWKIPENDWYEKMVDIKLNNTDINIFDLNEKEKEIFIKYVNHSINDIKYFLNIEIQMFSIDIQGINIIKELLSKLENTCSEIKKDIRLINAPNYKITMENEDLEILKTYISEYKKIEEDVKKDGKIMFECKKKSVINNLNKNILNF